MEEKTYKAIDLNLPSGTIWADRNVGAEKAQDNGLYFSWGNVEGHAVDENGNTTDGYSFDSDTYATTLGGQYTGSELDAAHDAATVNMGSKWRMATDEEINELVNNTDHYYIGEDGNIVAESELSSSKKLRSICFVKKDEAFNYDNRTNFIEFPFAGICDDSLLYLDGLDGRVWSNSVDGGDVYKARNSYFDNVGYLFGDVSDYRYFGISVRGVNSNNN